MAASRDNPGVLWAHNDSGDSARVFALTTSGQHLGWFTLSRKNSIALGFGTLVTGASVSPDGATVVLRTYGSVLVFSRPAGHPLHAAFRPSSCTGASAAEPQGEAIAITPDGRGYLTISEGATPPIYSFDV